MHVWPIAILVMLINDANIAVIDEVHDIANFLWRLSWFC